MTTLDRHLASRLLSTLARVIAVLVLLFVLVDLLTHRRTEILKHDVPWFVVLKYYGYLIPRILAEYQVAALGMLIASLLVLGSAAQHREITAMLAGGIGLWRLVRLPLLLAFGLSVAVFTMAETFGGVASRRAEEIETRYFARSPEGLRPGISWAHLPGGWKCHIMKFNRLALTGEDVLMLSIGSDKVEQVQAQRIYWDPDAGIWFLEDGLWSVFYPERSMEVVVTRITQTPAPISETPEELFALEGSPVTKNALALAKSIHHARELGMPVSRLSVDLHTKFSRPALCFIMMWIAIPFAVRLRSGGLAIGFSVSIGVGLLYLTLFSVAQGLGYIDRLPPFAAAWLANALFMAFGVAAFLRTPT